MTGAARVAKIVKAFARIWDPAGMRFARHYVNGLPGLVVVDDGRALTGVLVCAVAGGRVTAIDLIVNPHKLRHVAA